VPVGALLPGLIVCFFVGLLPRKEQEMTRDSAHDHYEMGMAWMEKAEAFPEDGHAYALLAQARFTAALCMNRFGVSLMMAEVAGTVPDLAEARRATTRGRDWRGA
jgi:hypothetical protein